MKQNLKIAILITIVTTVLLGVIYPLVVTGLAQLLFRDKANGQLIVRSGEVVGSRIIGQTFAGPGYLDSRPSAAGNGYDAANSGGTNLGPTNHVLIDRVIADVSRLRAENSRATSAHRSGDHLCLRTGSRPHSGSCGIPGRPDRAAERDERGTGAPDHSSAYTGPTVGISRRAKGECAGGEPRARPGQAGDIAAELAALKRRRYFHTAFTKRRSCRLSCASGSP